VPTGFTRAFRQELAHHEEAQPCCRLATVAGLMHTAGTFHIRGGATDEERYEVQLATTIQAAAKAAYSQFKAFGAEGELLTRREPRFRHRLVYELHLKGSPATIQALNEMGVLTDSFRLQPGIAKRMVKKGCCRGSFVRGCLIGAGFANAPEKEAHLEVVTSNENFAQDLAGLLTSMDFHPGLCLRRGAWVVYLKGREEVAGLLAQAGAYHAALMIEEQSVLKDVRSRANRVANCDAANLRRTSAAALRQMEAIELLEQTGLLASMPPALREMAELRMDHPYLNLTELAQEAGQGLTRSAVNHRLRRLVEAAERKAPRGADGRIRR
jgi:DNA-binding protein WhiA